MLFEFGMKSEKGFVYVLLLAYLYLLSTKMANSNLFGENISLIHQGLVAAYVKISDECQISAKN